MTLPANIVRKSVYAPGRAVTHHDVEETMDTSDEWIRQRRRFVERRFSSSHNDAETGSHPALTLSRLARCQWL
jgi:3-oxoacyl-[acyl-carrier-protein] synthase III